MATWHLTLASDGRQTLFPEEDGRRAAVRLLARAARDEMVLFCVVDDHVHVVVLAERPRVAKLGRALALGLRPLAKAPLDRPRIREVESRAHLQSLVSYVLGQPARHNLAVHPALWTGSCFLDLVGARWIPGLGLRLRDALPRLTRRTVRGAVGLDDRPIAPADDEALRVAGVARIVAATAAAHAVPESLPGKSAPIVTARRAAVQLARAAHIGPTDIAWALGIPTRAVRRLGSPPAPAELLDATRLRLALVEFLQGAPGAGPRRA